jgi:hypothetical protein
MEGVFLWWPFLLNFRLHEDRFFLLWPLHLLEPHFYQQRWVFLQQLLIYNVKAQYTSVETEFPYYRAQTNKSYC